MDVLILKADDWEGLFIDGNLVDEGHTLGEGESDTYLLKKSEEYKFTSNDVRVRYIYDADNEYLESYGSFPSELSKLKGKY